MSNFKLFNAAHSIDFILMLLKVDPSPTQTRSDSLAKGDRRYLDALKVDLFVSIQ